jgi:hypothetical protein
MNTKIKLAALAAVSLVAFAGLAQADILPLKPIGLKPPVGGPLPVIASVSATGTCGQDLSVTVVIAGGTAGGVGTVAGDFTGKYKVAPNATQTLVLPTTKKVQCSSTGAVLPSGNLWLEPLTTTSEMWSIGPATVIYTVSKQPIPG